MNIGKLLWLCLIQAVWLTGQFQLRAQSVQELGLPNPAKTEIVFPQVLFGKTPVGTIVTEIVIVNSSDKDAHVEVDLIGARGFAAEIIYDTSPFDRHTFRGARRGILPARSIWTIAYPPRNTGNLLDRGFTGWALVRSNEPLSAYRKIKVFDPDSRELASEVDTMGDSRPVVTAQIPVRLDSGSPRWNTGIAVVNPSTSIFVRPFVTVSVELLNFKNEVVQKKQLELRSRSQESFIASELFGPQESGGWTVRIRSEASEPFSFAAFDFVEESLFTRRRDLLSLYATPRIGRDPVTLQQLSFVETRNTAWNFPVLVTGTEKINDLVIFLTSMAFFVAAEDGSRWGPFEFSSATGVKTNPGLGIAVIQGDGLEKSILFAQKRKVVTEPMYGKVADIVEIPENKLVEIRSFGSRYVGWIQPVASYILVDREKGEVVARFSGPSHLLPPWRQ